MADDVLNHHDGVVDQDADGEDKGEQADPVDGVAHQPGGEEGQQDGGRHHHHDDEALAPTQYHGDQENDGERRQAQMEQKLVGFLGRRFAVVAGHGH